MKPGQKNFKDSEKIRKLRKIQDTAVLEGWFKHHPDWVKINNMRLELGLTKVVPVDRPSSATFVERRPRRVTGSSW